MSEYLLKINDLSASYGDEDIVKEVSLCMQPGEVVCIVGESGSGKSTLIKAIHGMSGVGITGGTIVFDDADITALPARDRRKLMGTGIGLIPQDPQASFNPIRKLDVQFREALAGHDLPYDEGRIDEMLRKIGLQHGKAVLKNRPFELSGGMNQRIAIAAAMLFEPRLLLCDEATSALDVTTAGAVVEELLKIRETNGTSILLVTHHLGIARKMADNIGIMKDGRIIEYGNTEKIFDSPQNEYTKKLIRDVPKLKK